MSPNRTTNWLSPVHPISRGSADISLRNSEIFLYKAAEFTSSGEHVFGLNARVILIELRDVNGQFGCSPKRLNLAKWSSHIAGVRAATAYVSEHHFIGHGSDLKFGAIKLRPVADHTETSTFTLSELFAFGCNPRDFREYVCNLLTFSDGDSPLDATVSLLSRSWVLGISDCSQSAIAIPVSEYCAQAGLFSDRSSPLTLVNFTRQECAESR